ncbi:MAG: MFS transporter [Armatimonadota bacterium]
MKFIQIDILKKHTALLIVATASFLGQLSYATLNYSAQPMYVTYSIKQGQFLGLIFSVFLLSEAVSRLIFGTLGDKKGRKPLLLLGPTITIFTATLTVYFHSPIALIALRLLDGIGAGAFWPTAFASAGDLVSEKNRTSAMSIINFTYLGGLALGFLAGGYVNEIFQTFNASFYLVSVLMFICALVILIFLKEKYFHKTKHTAFENDEMASSIKKFKISDLSYSFKKHPQLMLLAFFTFAGIGLLMPVCKLFAVERLGLSETQFGLAVAPLAAVMALCAVPMGRFSDKYGRTYSLSYGLISCAIAIWLIVLFPYVSIYILASIIVGIGFTSAFPAWMSIVSSTSNEERKGEMLGAVGMVQGISAILGASFGAYMYATDTFSIPRLGIASSSMPFWLCALLLSLSAVLSIHWSARKVLSKENEKSPSNLQSSIIKIMSILGLACIIYWISWKYIKPLPPERVAWDWVHMLIEQDYDNAKKIIDPKSEIAKNKLYIENYGKLYNYWQSNKQARYTVLPAKRLKSDLIEVPVRFIFPGHVVKIEKIYLCSKDEKEWLVCNIYSQAK